MRHVAVTSGVLAGCRRAALPFASVVVALLAPASAAEAQRLLTLVSGVGEAASVGDPGHSVGPVPTAVQVDLELLRAAPARLEVPTPDGSVLSAERSVFEDRGGGDLMWSGGQPGAGYDTVVLTVEGGRLVGRFGAAGGGVYQIHAERDGRGGMAPIAGPRLEAWCGVEAGAEDGHDAHAHVGAGAHAADPPRRVSNPQNHDRLDILVAYTATAAENWADRGGAHAAIRHAGDYLKMVFRNNDLPVEPHIVHIAQAPAALDRAGRDLGIHEFEPRPMWTALKRDGELRRLRHEHRSDLVHLIVGERVQMLRACGSSLGLWSGDAESYPANTEGWSTNDAVGCPDYAVLFAHEIGHAFGANHDPANVYRPEDLYAVGYVNYDVMPSLGTAMSYQGQIEPFFSTPRIRPWGAAVGSAEQDNERRLRETVHIVARYSDYLMSLEGLPAPPSDLRVRLDDGAAHLSWRDNAPDADGYEVRYLWQEPGGPKWGGGHRIRIEGRSGATVPLEFTKPGTRYDFMVRATKGEARSLRSSIVRLDIPEPIEAPSGVSVTIDHGLVQAGVRWTDNSDNESGFDVQLLQDGEPIARNQVAADRERSFFGRHWVEAQGGAEYGVRVFAFNSSGYSESSETATFRWEHRDAPGPIAGVSVAAIGPTTVRVTWTVDPEVNEYHVYAQLPQWEDRRIRMWQPSHSASASTARMDFKNLARGGRYRFYLVGKSLHGSSVPSVSHLTLGERGAGPRAPSDVSWVVEGRRAQVSWKDNSRDELGFEVQYASKESLDRAGSLDWLRVLTVPADTESAAHDVATTEAGYHFRVFAYNDRGYSRASAPAPLTASFRLDIPCDEELCRTVTGTPVSFVDTSGGNVTEWRWRFGDGAASNLRSPTHAWSTPGFYAVTLTVSDGSSSDSATRTVLVVSRRLEASFQVDIPCEEDLCRTFTDAPVSFLDTSGGNVTEWRWSFGDGAASNLSSPTHAWSTPGFYDVTLTVGDGSSSDSATRTVLVAGRRLEASFRLDIPCEEDLCRTFTDTPVSFVDTSGGNVTEWRWSFGDGATSNLRSPTHAWSTPGFYDVTLTVSDGSRSDSATRTVLVAGRRLEASFRLDIPCEEDLCRTLTDAPVSFLDTSGGNVTEWRWRFGDGAASNLRSPTHAWSTPGFYAVTLTVSDGSSSDSATRTVLVVSRRLEASFQVDIPCEEDLCRTFTDAPVSFLDTSGGNVTEWRWSFGDGAASNLSSPTHAWSTPGFYDVTLTVGDGSSSDSATRTVLVAGRRLEASFRLDIPCEEDLCRTFTDTPVSFVDTSGGNVTEWRWSFGDGATSNLRSPTHAWSTPGFYDVTLTVSDGSRSDSATRTVLVAGRRLEASFRLDIPCEEDLCRTLTDAPVSFLDTSGGNVTEWRWRFGDGAASNLRSPTHAWSTPGFYAVTLTVSDGSSSDSATRTVLVVSRRLEASFQVDIPCEEDLCRTFTDAPVSFLDTSGGNVTEWRWSFGDGAASNLSSPTHAWSTPGFYDVTLTVGDGSSSDSATRTVLVAGRRLEASFRLDIPCEEDLCRTFTDTPVSFVDTSGGNVTEWRWSFGDGATSNLRSPTHAWSTPGFYDVTLTVSDGSRSDSATRTVLVAGRRLEASFRLDIPCEEDLCRTLTDAPVSFLDTSGGNVTEWRWSFGDGATSNLRSPTHAWSTPGFYDVTLTVGDGSSSDSATRTVLVVSRRLEASFRLDIPCGEDLCRTLTDAPVSFVDTSGGNVTEWRWSFGDGATSNQRSPTHAWSTPGFYDVTLTVSDGSSSDSATRTVLVEAAAPAGSCRFDEETLCLRDSRLEVKVNWWSADGESGSGRVVYAGTNDSGLFQFFGPENWEILIKVLDGCRINGRMWVLGAATTDLGYRIRVADTLTEEARVYTNEPGQPAPAIVDTKAFSLACVAGAAP